MVSKRLIKIDGHNFYQTRVFNRTNLKTYDNNLKSKFVRENCGKRILFVDSFLNPVSKMLNTGIYPWNFRTCTSAKKKINKLTIFYSLTLYAIQSTKYRILVKTIGTLIFTRFHMIQLRFDNSNIYLS